MGLGLVEDLEAKDVIGESLSEFLPSYLFADVFKVSRNAAFVVGVRIAFEVRSFTFYHNDPVDWLSILPTLHDEVRPNAISAVALNRKVFGTDEIAIPP